MSKTAILVLLLLLLVAPSTAEIKTVTITSDTRPDILFETFGFTKTGHVAMAVSSVSVVAPSPPPDPSRLGFYLISEKSLHHAQIELEAQQNPSFCMLDYPYMLRLFTFFNLSNSLPAPSFNHTYHVTSSNQYSLYFANCASKSSVSMTVHSEFFNLDHDGSRNYLTSGKTNLPPLFFVFSITYFVFLVFWLYLCHVIKHSLDRIHLLMALLLFMNALNLLCAAVDLLFVKITGTPHGWDVLFFMFNFIRVILSFTVIISVGTRWTFLHPLAPERGKKVLFIIIPLQVLANVVLVVIHKTRPYAKDWDHWGLLLFLLDFGSCFLIFFLFVWSIGSLAEIGPCRSEDKAAVNLDEFKVITIKWFYKVVIGYFLLTRVVLVPLRTLVAYNNNEWAYNLVLETATLAFFIVMFYAFRLLEKDEEKEQVDERNQNIEVEL